MITTFVFSILNLSHTFGAFVHAHASWAYLVMFLTLFAETGLVIVPFLPGDSLLLITGTLAAQGTVNPLWAVLALLAGATVGNLSNFWIGSWVGPKVFHYEESRWFNPAHLHQAHGYFQRYGGVTLIIGRLIPVVRTFAPFVAGIGRMHFVRFLLYTLVGAGIWIGLLFGAGYYFGNIPWIRTHLIWGTLAIIVASVIPVGWHLLHRRARPAT